MPLLRKIGSSAPKELALFWEMQTLEGQVVSVYAYASALQAIDAAPTGPVGLLKRHRALLEKVASDKFDRAGGMAAGPLHIAAEDLLQSMPIEASGIKRVAHAELPPNRQHETF